MNAERQRYGPRFGIGEIYGHSADLLPTYERKLLIDAKRGTKPCPFRKGQGACIKNGGVTFNYNSSLPSHARYTARINAVNLSS